MVVDHEPAPADCAVAAQRYASRFGWPCVAHGFAVWALAGEAFDAVDIPAHLGPAVLAALRRRTGCPHDVIEAPGDPPYWRFLVLPRKHTGHRDHATLEGHGATYLTNADRIELPPTRVPGGELRWVRAPIGRLAPLHEIITALPTRDDPTPGDKHR